MVEFIDTVTHPDRADRLGHRDPPRRVPLVQDTLARLSADRDRWYAFSDDRQRGRARARLAEARYRPRNPAVNTGRSARQDLPAPAVAVCV